MIDVERKGKIVGLLWDFVGMYVENCRFAVLVHLQAHLQYEPTNVHARSIGPQKVDSDGQQ